MDYDGHRGPGTILDPKRRGFMKETDYRQWLKNQDYQENTISSRMSNIARVEKVCGDLEEHYTRDRMANLIEVLQYSRDDQRRNRPNLSEIPINGDIYNNLATYRSAAELYKRFRDETEDGGLETPESKAAGNAASLEDVPGQRMGLERDLQAALRSEIEPLEPGLRISDGGTERSVDSGFIDITARDSSGTTVVIELKSGVAGQRAVAQILSYMGDVCTEEDGDVRGILVAFEFDAKAKAAARMVPSLILRQYTVRFEFSDT